MRLRYFDAHTHFDGYGDNAAATAAAMRGTGIGACAVSVGQEGCLSAEPLQKINPYIIFAAGVHPWHAAEGEIDWQAMDALFQRCQVVGEIGLDKKWAEPDSFHAQMEVFVRQLEFACRYQKPANLHTSGADLEVINLLRAYSPPGVLIHWFDGPMQFLFQYLDLGCYVSVAADVDITEEKRQICKAIPTGRLLCETDGPRAIAWALNRAVCDEDYKPDAILRIYEKAAIVRGIQKNQYEKFCRQVTQNAIECFNIKKNPS